MDTPASAPYSTPPCFSRQVLTSADIQFVVEREPDASSNLKILSFDHSSLRKIGALRMKHAKCRVQYTLLQRCGCRNRGRWVFNVGEGRFANLFIMSKVASLRETWCSVKVRLSTNAGSGFSLVPSSKPLQLWCPQNNFLIDCPISCQRSTTTNRSPLDHTPQCRRGFLYRNHMWWHPCQGPLIVQMEVMLLVRFMAGCWARRKERDQSLQ